MFKSTGSLTLDSLIAIRREFFLERLDLETAKRQVDIALTGLDASQVFEGYVSNLLSLLRDAAAEFDRCAEHLKKLEGLYPEMKISPTGERMSGCKSEFDSIAKSIEKVETIVRKSVPEALKPLNIRINIVSLVFRNPDIFKDIRLKISNEIDHFEQKREDFTKKLHLFGETYLKHDETVESGQSDGQSA
jgi:hypothetical protein